MFQDSGAVVCVRKKAVSTPDHRSVVQYLQVGSAGVGKSGRRRRSQRVDVSTPLLPSRATAEFRSGIARAPNTR